MLFINRISLIYTIIHCNILLFKGITAPVVNYPVHLTTLRGQKPSMPVTSKATPSVVISKTAANSHSGNNINPPTSQTVSSSAARTTGRNNQGGAPGGDNGAKTAASNSMAGVTTNIPSRPTASLPSTRTHSPSTVRYNAATVQPNAVHSFSTKTQGLNSGTGGSNNKFPQNNNPLSTGTSPQRHGVPSAMYTTGSSGRSTGNGAYNNGPSTSRGNQPPSTKANPIQQHIATSGSNSAGNGWSGGSMNTSGNGNGIGSHNKDNANRECSWTKNHENYFLECKLCTVNCGVKRLWFIILDFF